jgi:CDP-diacylglycerol---glycerol-3-phosphate 3-phosphatidyltransferase
MGLSKLPEENSVPGLQASRKALARYVTGPLVRLLARTSITPNGLTVCSLGITIIAAALVVFEYFIAAALVMLFASVFDILDGALARSTNRVTKFGAALDSSLDRLAEAVIFIALMVVYTRDQSVVGVTLTGAALVCSLMVSYVRARAEGLGVDCQVGIFTRAERIAVLVIGLLLGRFSWVIPAALVVIIVLSSITVGQRLYQIWKKTRT